MTLEARIFIFYESVMAFGRIRLSKIKCDHNLYYVGGSKATEVAFALFTLMPLV